MNKHTPTPWEIVPGARGEAIAIRASDDHFIIGRVLWQGAQGEPYSNAKFIERSVNTHDRLILIARNHMKSCRLCAGSGVFDQSRPGASTGIPTLCEYCWPVMVTVAEAEGAEQPNPQRMVLERINDYLRKLETDMKSSEGSEATLRLMRKQWTDLLDEKVKIMAGGVA